MSKCIPGKNDLLTLYPEIAKLWHPTLNAPLLPSEVSAHNHNKYYWLCPKGHTWEASPGSLVQNRKKSMSCGCSVCNGKTIVKGINDLASQAPEIADQWDYIKNEQLGLTPETVSAFSGRVVYWIGKCGHRWPARIGDRVRKHTGCKYCDKKEHLTGVNDLETVAPGLCSQWDMEKNKKRPSEVASNTHDKYWWKCEFGHSWEESPNRRIQKYKKNHFVGCPECTKALRISFPEKCVFYYVSQVFNDAVENYLISNTRQEFDIYIPSKRIAIEYDGAAYHSKTRIANDEKKNLWCKDHDIKMIRVRESSCPTLRDDNQKTIIIDKDPTNKQLDISIKELLGFLTEFLKESLVVSISTERDADQIRKMMKMYLVNNSIKKTRPDILAEWDYEKNNQYGFYPEGLTSGSSSVKVWWKCSYNHSYRKSPNEKIRLGKGCPYCAGKKVMKGENDFASRFPELLKEWDYSKNTLKPDEVVAFSSKRAYWICKNNPQHKWDSVIGSRAAGHGCPYCTDHKILVNENDFKTNYSDVAAEWDYEKNKPNIPEEFSSSSRTTVWWIGKCGHSWDMPIVSRTGKRPQGCPYCSGRRVLIGFNDFPSVNPDAFKEWDWDANKGINPHYLTSSSHVEAYWVCIKNPNHKWKTTVKSRMYNGCPYCSGNKVLAGDNDLKTKYPEVAVEWDYEKNSPLVPEEFTSGSTKVVWWKGKCGHSWEMQIGLRTGKRSQGCPYCAGKQLLKGFNDLASQYPEVAAMWDYSENKGLSPEDVLAGSGMKVHWYNDDGSKGFSSVSNKTASWKRKQLKKA